jgi:hypothetical protein
MLCEQVLAPKIKVTMLPPPEERGQDFQRDGSTEPLAAGRGRGRAPVQGQDELVPDLISFLQTHPEIKAVVKVAKVLSQPATMQQVLQSLSERPGT